MARHSVAFGDSQLRPGSAERAGSRNRPLEISAELERKWFEFDRNVVTGVLNNLQRSIHQGATQMEMIAAEQMFDTLLSKTLSRTARRLERVTLNLERLTREVNDTIGYPKPAKV
jgi:hypothetical protein